MTANYVQDHATVTLYRSAHHPEFVAKVIVPALAVSGLDERCAPVVADIMDHNGCSVEYAVHTLASVMEPYAGVLLSQR